MDEFFHKFWQNSFKIALNGGQNSKKCSKVAKNV